MSFVTENGGLRPIPAPSLHLSTWSFFWQWYFGGNFWEYYLRAYSLSFLWFGFKLRDVIFSVSSSPHPPPCPPHHHIDRFGATCSLHSQEDGKAPSCQILSFIHNNALSSISGGKSPPLASLPGSVFGRSTVCTVINSVGLAEGGRLVV